MDSLSTPASAATVKKAGVGARPVGMVLAIEPMLIAGGHDSCCTARDGWTVRTTDATRAAHTEHTVAVTNSGPRILTQA